MYALEDDIVALATPVGQSALAVVRVSGKNIKKLYQLITQKKQLPKPNFSNPSFIFSDNSNKPLDYAVITYFKAPKSF